MYGEILEEEMARESVFKDQSKLSPDYVPQKLVHRDEEFRKLSRLFRPVLENRASQRVLVTGSVGVGKTALTLKFGKQLEPAAKKRNFRLDYIHINCRKQKTPYMVLRQMIDHYNPRLPPRGFSPEELLGMVIDWLDKHDAYLTLTLDELGFFIQQNSPDLLYSLTRAAEESGAQNRLSIIAISRDQNFLRLLDSATQSTFMHNLIKLDKYNARQLDDILKQRVREAFKAGKVEEDTVSLISDIAARWGDARFALELLSHAGMFADGKKAKKVTP
ncbi:MAG: AAA family ATPase, partial [Candidatus Hadarchaeota archaeon]|nr:AAA family ATPase [Candidatus Hadarchaeota archaeon]